MSRIVTEKIELDATNKFSCLFKESSNHLPLKKRLSNYVEEL